jgi:hypothetical protein
MNDEIIVFSDAINQLTDERKLQHKIHDDYSYQLKKDSGFYSGRNYRNEITVKADEFYTWIIKRISANKLPDRIRSKVHPKYRTHVIGANPLTVTPTVEPASFTVIRNFGDNPTTDQLVIIAQDKIIDRQSNKINELENDNRELKASIIQLEKELAETKPKAKKWDDWNKNKGKKQKNVSEKNND